MLTRSMHPVRTDISTPVFKRDCLCRGVCVVMTSGLPMCHAAVRFGMQGQLQHMPFEATAAWAAVCNDSCKLMQLQYLPRCAMTHDVLWRLLYVLHGATGLAHTAVSGACKSHCAALCVLQLPEHANCRRTKVYHIAQCHLFKYTERCAVSMHAEAHISQLAMQLLKVAVAARHSPLPICICCSDLVHHHLLLCV